MYKAPSLIFSTGEGERERESCLCWLSDVEIKGEEKGVRL
jgi:hypothetical protein